MHSLDLGHYSHFAMEQLILCATAPVSFHSYFISVFNYSFSVPYDEVYSVLFAVSTRAPFMIVRACAAMNPLNGLCTLRSSSADYLTRERAGGSCVGVMTVE